MTADELRHQISTRLHWIDSLENEQHTADGLAYSQNVNRIQTYRQEIRDLERKLKERYDDASSL